ncbi:scabin-related ADP-ribosyltransferase [Saccharopolyspora sp. CA-218241]|uniref:scabin-related ADP-ribosyltransferase n=1 Tax=Saccharopolyspora sp. CA-218241 TaxID=3240027 RepID=UPI003D985F21
MTHDSFAHVKGEGFRHWGPGWQQRVAEDAAIRAESLGYHDRPDAPPEESAGPPRSTPESMAAEVPVEAQFSKRDGWALGVHQSKTPAMSDELRAKLGAENIREIRNVDSGLSMAAHPSTPYYGSVAHARSRPWAAVDPKRFTVEVHGSPNGVRMGSTELNAKELAEIIRGAPGYQPGSPVRLLACRTGGDTADGSPNFAEELARELDVEVLAPNTDAWGDNHGNMYASGSRASFDVDASGTPQPHFDEPGTWTSFRPDGSTAVHDSPFPPGHRPEWVKFGHWADAAWRRGYENPPPEFLHPGGPAFSGGLQHRPDDYGTPIPGHLGPSGEFVPHATLDQYGRWVPHGQVDGFGRWVPGHYEPNGNLVPNGHYNQRGEWIAHGRADELGRWIPVHRDSTGYHDLGRYDPHTHQWEPLGRVDPSTGQFVPNTPPQAPTPQAPTPQQPAPNHTAPNQAPTPPAHPGPAGPTGGPTQQAPGSHAQPAGPPRPAGAPQNPPGAPQVPHNAPDPRAPRGPVPGQQGPGAPQRPGPGHQQPNPGPPPRTPQQQPAGPPPNAARQGPPPGTPHPAGRPPAQHPTPDYSAQPPHAPRPGEGFGPQGSGGRADGGFGPQGSGGRADGGFGPQGSGGRADGGFGPQGSGGRADGGFGPQGSGGRADGGFGPQGSGGRADGGFGPQGSGGRADGGFGPQGSGGRADGGFGPQGSGGRADGGFGPQGSGGRADGGFGPQGSGGRADGGFGPQGSGGRADGGFGPQGFGGRADGGFGPQGSGGRADGGFGPQGSGGRADGGFGPQGSGGRADGGPSPANSGRVAKRDFDPLGVGDGRAKNGYVPADPNSTPEARAKVREKYEKMLGDHLEPGDIDWVEQRVDEELGPRKRQPQLHNFEIDDSVQAVAAPDGNDAFGSLPDSAGWDQKAIEDDLNDGRQGRYLHWRTDTDVLYRSDLRHPNEVWGNQAGFQARSEDLSLDKHFDGNRGQGGGLVSTTRDEDYARDRALSTAKGSGQKFAFVYQIDAGGGIDMNMSSENLGHDTRESEVGFVGGIDFRYVPSCDVYDVETGELLGTFHNPYYYKNLQG